VIDRGDHALGVVPVVRVCPVRLWLFVCWPSPAVRFLLLRGPTGWRDFEAPVSEHRQHARRP
jgi:hypothetical protein